MSGNQSDLVLENILGDVMVEVKVMIARDPSPEGRRAARAYALTEPARRVEKLKQD